MAQPVSGQNFLVGQELGHYRLIEKIGEGGMGVVYRARDEHLSRDVAIKVLPAGTLANERDRQRFRKEALALSGINHPNIAVIHDFDTSDGIDYLVEELIPGVSLDQMLKSGALSERECIYLGMQLCAGLASAHARSLIHRDIKPGNIRVKSDGLLKILDFGLAQAFVSPDASGDEVTTLSRPQVVEGTLPYMSPEQLRNEKLDARTDIWSAGCVLYEMATGRRPFSGSGVTLTDAILHGPPPSACKLNRAVSSGLEATIQKCLAKDPGLRYQSAREVAADLKRLAAPSSGIAVTPAKTWRAIWLVSLVFAAVVVFAAIWQFTRTHRTHALAERDTIVLTDFVNKTGDAVFDGTLKQALAIQLEQSPFLNVLPDRKVADTLGLMNRQPSEHITEAVGREICIRTGSKATLTGSITALGSQYAIMLRAAECQTGDSLASVEAEADGREHVLRTLSDAATSMRQKLGESLSSIKKLDRPLDEATTSSLEALKAYSLGMKAQATEGFAAGLPFFQRAIDLDPGFAIAYNAIGDGYFVLNEAQRGAGYVRKAYELRAKASQRERFEIEGDLYFYVNGDLEKAAQTYALWQQTYPGDVESYIQLGFVSTALGDWEKCLEQFSEALRLDPSNMANHVNLGITYTVLNRLDNAQNVYKDSERLKLQSEPLLQSRYWLAFLKGDQAKMAQLVAEAMGKPGSEDLLLATQADTEGWYGKLKSAHELTRRAMYSAQRNGAQEAAAAYQAAAALREVEVGYREQALADARAAVRLAPNRDVQAMGALAMARAGDAAGAENLAAELEKNHPLDTLVQTYWLPSIRAAIALDHHDFHRAIQLLETAYPIELSEPSQFTIFLCPVYVRGEAYLMLHDGDRAAAEFQKFIEHRGLVMNFPWGTLARLGLARARAQTGDITGARQAYDEFFTIWKDADPDIPIYRQAKTEYAKLQ